MTRIQGAWTDGHVQSQQLKVAGIDQLRGLAALSVVICHIAGQFYGWDRASAGPERIFGWLGQWGVALFFVISGFCIRLPMARARIEDPQARLDVQEYILHRLVRIAPPYWAAIIASTLVGVVVIAGQITGSRGGWDIALHVLALHTLWPATFYSINGVFWTIGLEVHFYLAYLLLANRETSWRMFLGLLVLGLAFYGLASKLLPTPNPWRIVGQEFFVTSFWQWYLGAWLADAYVKRRPVMSRVVLWGTRGASLALGWGLGLVDPIFMQLHLTYWAVPLMAALVVWTFAARSRTASRSNVLASSLGGVGRISYSLYLLHPAVLALAVFAFRPLGLPLWIQATLALVGALMAAWLGYRLIERPLLLWKARQGSTADHIVARPGIATTS